MSEKRQAFVYVGPSRPFNLPIMGNAILASEPERVFPAIKPFFDTHRQFKKLFVPVDKLAQTRQALKDPGSAISIWRDQIREASENMKASNLAKGGVNGN